MYRNFFSKKMLLGISEKKNGSMKLFNCADQKNLENRKKFFKNNNINVRDVVASEIKNSFAIKIVGDKDKSKLIKNCDGLITNSKNLILSITVADCVPIYFYDPVNNVIGIAHAGWREVIGNIVKNMLEIFKGEFNSKLKDVKIFIGPHIKQCHFEVKSDVAKRFSKYRSAVIQKESKIYINLAEVMRTQLLQNGLEIKNIKESKECTYCESQKYFSFRRDRPENIEAMVAYIGLK